MTALARQLSKDEIVCPSPCSYRRVIKEKGSEKMLRRLLFVTGIVIGAIAVPDFVFAGPLVKDLGGYQQNSLFHNVGCNPNDEDKQGKCMQKCDDEYIKASQAYSNAGKLEGPKEAKHVCEKACGC
jgi:hypothetical protein